MKYIKMFFTALLDKTRTIKAKWKTLSKGQKVKRVIILLIILALLLVVVDWFSPRTIVGIDRTTITKTVKGENLYDPAVFVDSMISKSTPNNKTVTVHYPTTGNEKLDTAIKSKAEEFGEQVAAKASVDELYNQSSFAYKNKVFVTFSNNNVDTTSTVFKTFGFTTSGEYTESIFKNDDYKQVSSDVASQFMNATFNVENEITRPLIAAALENRDYRLASNGLVIQIPTAKLPKGVTGAAFYEILIPIDALKGSLE